MSLLSEIKRDLDVARREKNTVILTILTTLYSEAAMVGKTKRNGESTDEEVLSVIRKFKQGVEEIGRIKLFDRMMMVEIGVYDSYLPTTMSEDELTIEIIEFVNTLPDKSPKQMGVVMKHLKDNFGGRYDGKLASELVKTALN